MSTRYGHKQNRYSKISNFILDFEQSNINVELNRLLFYAGEKSILQETIYSEEPVVLHILKDNLSDLERREVESIKKRYVDFFYKDTKEIKTLKDLNKIDRGIFLNMYQGGKYLEEYTHHEILLVLLIRHVELKDYCIKLYKEYLKGRYNFYEDILQVQTKSLELIELDLLNNNKIKKGIFQKIIQDIHDNYGTIRGGKYIMNIDLFKNETSFFEVFKTSLEIIKKINLETAESIVRQLFREWHISIKTFAKDKAYESFTNKDDFNYKDYIVEYTKIMSPSNNPQIKYSKFSIEMIEQDIMPEVIKEIEQEFQVFNLKNLKLNDFKDIKDNSYDYILKYQLDKKLHNHTVLGFNIIINIYRYFLYVYNINILTGFYDLDTKIPKDFINTPCGIFNDMNVITNLINHVLTNRYNNDLLFCCRMNLAINYETTQNPVLDLSLLRNINDDTSFDISKPPMKQIKKEDVIAIIIIKFKTLTGEILFKYLFVTEGNGYGQDSYLMYDFGSDNEYEICDIKGQPLFIGQILPKKSFTHMELLFLVKIFKSTSYSIGFKNYESIDINQLPDKYKPFLKYFQPLTNNNIIDINKIYSNNTLFFSNYTWDEIKYHLDKYRRMGFDLIEKINKYEITEQRDKAIENSYPGKFDNFNIRLVDSYQPVQGGGGLSIKTVKNTMNVTQLLKKYRKELDTPDSYINSIEYDDKIADMISHNGRVNQNLWTKFNMLILDNLIPLSYFYNIVYPLDNLYYFPEHYGYYYVFNELIKSHNIYINGKDVLEIGKNNLISFEHRKDLNKIYCINFAALDDSLNKDMSSNRIALNLDNLISQYNKLTVKIIRDDIYKITELKQPKVDILIYKNDLFELNGDAMQYHILTYYVILVSCIKYLNIDGTAIIETRTITTKAMYQIIYLLEQMFNDVQLSNLECEKHHLNKGIYIVCKEFKESSIATSILNKYIEIKKIFKDGIYKMNDQLIESLIDDEIPKETINKINKVLDDKYEIVELRLKHIVDLLEKAQTNNVSIQLVNEQNIKNTQQYFNKYNIKYEKKLFEKISEIPYLTIKELNKNPKKQIKTKSKTKSVTNSSKNKLKTKTKSITNSSKSKLETKTKSITNSSKTKLDTKTKSKSNSN
jgi:hypothetical protein